MQIRPPPPIPAAATSQSTTRTGSRHAFILRLQSALPTLAARLNICRHFCLRAPVESSVNLQQLSASARAPTPRAPSLTNINITDINFDETGEFNDYSYSANYELEDQTFTQDALDILQEAQTNSKILTRQFLGDHGEGADVYYVGDQTLPTDKENAFIIKAKALLLNAFSEIFPSHTQTKIKDSAFQKKLEDVLEFSTVRFISQDQEKAYTQGWHVDTDGLSLVHTLSNNSGPGTLYYQDSDRITHRTDRPTPELEKVGGPYEDRTQINYAQLQTHGLRDAGKGTRITFHYGYNFQAHFGTLSSVHAAPMPEHANQSTGLDRRWVVVYELNPRADIQDKNFFVRLKIARLAHLILNEAEANQFSERLFNDNEVVSDNSSANKNDEAGYLQDHELSGAIRELQKIDVTRHTDSNSRCTLERRYTDYTWAMENDLTYNQSPFDRLLAEVTRDPPGLRLG